MLKRIFFFATWVSLAGEKRTARRGLGALAALVLLAACTNQDEVPGRPAPVREGSPANAEAAVKPADVSQTEKKAPSISSSTTPPIVPPTDQEPATEVSVATVPPLKQETPTPAQPEQLPTVKIGLLLPLSGRQAAIGKALLDAASMALFDLGEPWLELMPRDTGGDPAMAAAAATLLLDEGASLLLGPLLSDSVAAVAPLALARGVNVIAFSSDDAVARPGVYLLSFTPQQEVMRIVRHARGQDLERFAALVPDNAYGRTVVAALKAALARFGGVLLQIEYYPASGEGAEKAVQRLAHFRERRMALTRRREELSTAGGVAATRELRRLEALETLGHLDYQAILLPEGGQVLTRIAPLLPYYDINMRSVKLLGTGLWNDNSIVREPVLHGATFAAPSPQAFRRFARRFKRFYGNGPPRLASLAYDAAAIAAVLSRGPDNLGFEASALTLAEGFDGKDGLFRFRPDGRAERGLAVLEVTPDGVRLVIDAPANFDDLTN